jgi:hypothetical protein
VRKKHGSDSKSARLNLMRLFLSFKVLIYFIISWWIISGWHPLTLLANTTGLNVLFLNARAALLTARFTILPGAIVAACIGAVKL